jgi:hypothetical protein
VFFAGLGLPKLEMASSFLEGKGNIGGILWPKMGKYLNNRKGKYVNPYHFHIFYCHHYRIYGYHYHLCFGQVHDKTSKTSSDKWYLPFLLSSLLACDCDVALAFELFVHRLSS